MPLATPAPTKYGPKMQALPNDRWRTFALVYCGQGRRNAGHAYAVAFEKDERDVKQSHACRVNGSRMVHDERMQQAILEVCQKQLRSLAPLAVDVFEEIAQDRQRPAGDRIRAAQAIADRTGLHGINEHKTTVQHIGGDGDQMKRIAALASLLGIPVERFIGHRIEAPVIDITPDPEPDLVTIEQHYPEEPDDDTGEPEEW